MIEEALDLIQDSKYFTKIGQVFFNFDGSKVGWNSEIRFQKRIAESLTQKFHSIFEKLKIIKVANLSEKFLSRKFWYFQKKVVKIKIVIKNMKF